MGIKIDLLGLLSFEMNEELKSLFDLSQKEISTIIEPRSISHLESGHSVKGIAALNQNKFSNLTLLNQTIYCYFINDHSFGFEFLNWKIRTSYISEDEALREFYKNPFVMDMGLNEILDFFETHNINVKLTDSEDDPNYLRINCDKYEDWTNFDQLIIFDKGSNRIDYFLANKNSVRNVRNINK